MNSSVLVIPIGLMLFALVSIGCITSPISIEMYQEAIAQISSSSAITTANSTSTTKATNNTNYSTYGNSTYGIKIHYPSDWLYKAGANIGVNNDNAGNMSSSAAPQTIVSFTPAKSPMTANLTIGVMDFNIPGLTVNFISNMLMANREHIFPGTELSESKSITVAGRPGYEFVLVRGQDNLKVMAVFTVNEDKGYLMGYVAKSPEVYSTYLPIVQKMIGSFQFVGGSSNTSKALVSSSEQFGSKGQSSTNSITNYSKYNGNNFSLQYPVGWEIQRSDMGVPGSEIIRISNRQFSEFVQVFSAPTSIEPAKNATQAEVNSHLEEIFPIFVKGILSGIKNGTLTELQKPVYDRYVVDGHKVGSTTFTHDYSGVLVKSLAIGTIVNGNDFGLMFTAPAAVFDQQLPFIENMIKSLKFLSNP